MLPLIRSRYWLLQLLGWSAFAVNNALGALAYSETKQVLLHRGTLLVTGFFCTFLLHSTCRRFWNSQLPWPRLMVLTVLLCYALGFVCAFCAFVAEDRLFPSAASPSTLGASAAIGLSGAANASFVLLAWCGIYLGIKQWDAAHQREERLLRAESLAREAALRALRSELTPHFLFNTLNGVSTLVGEGRNQEAREMLARLGRFLRATLDGAGGGDVTLDDELDHLREYLEIEKVRLGDRLQVRFSVAAGVGNALLPNLLLQPLVENAVRHGVASIAEGGEIRIDAGRSGQRVRISVFNRTALGAVFHADPVSHGVGLANIRDRLAARYGDDHRFEVRNQLPNSWEVMVEIPFPAESERRLAP